MVNAIMAQDVPAMGRRSRRPQFPFNLKSRPFQVQPFMIAPVLAGETMKNLLLQSRVVTDPIKNPLIGWWKEYYFFYVKLRDFIDRDAFMDMLIDPNKDMAAMNSAINLKHNHTSASRIDYVKRCLEIVTNEYFRAEGETYSTALIDTLPLVATNFNGITDSAILDSAYVRPDVNVDLNANTTITASEVDEALREYQWLRSNGLTDVSYQDYLGYHGIKWQEDDPHIPELVRYVREWTYPTNTINPSSGQPSSACSWAITERADKDRFFREPGFLFGVTVTRPKVYMGRIDGNMADFLNNSLHWMNAVLDDDPHTSMMKYAGGAGPLKISTNPYWVDWKDLFMYGDQFVNYDLATTTDTNIVALPTSVMQKRYPSSADLDGLFAAVAPANQVKEDGLVSLTIATRLRDLTGTV